MDEAEEILDLVDENDKVFGTVARGEFDHHKNGYVRAAEAFIINESGELWIPRRTAHKTHAPNGLDFSVSEHVTSGESYLQAIIRGFQEELKTGLTSENLQEVGIIKPTDTMPWFAAIYVYKSNIVPDFNTKDFTGGRWISITDLLAILDAGEPAKTGLRPAVQFLQSKLSTAGSKGGKA